MNFSCSEGRSLISLGLRTARVDGVGEAVVSPSPRPFGPQGLIASGEAATYVVALRPENGGCGAHRYVTLLPGRKRRVDVVSFSARARVQDIGPQYPRALGVGRRSRGEQVERDE